MRHIRFAFRTLFRTPFVTLIAVLSLALGIGANTAIFSLFNELLRRPLPVPRPSELVNLSGPGVKSGSNSCGNEGDCEDVFSYPMFQDLERDQAVFTGIAAHVIMGGNFAYRGQPESGSGVLVSGSYFPVLGLTPAAGRLFGPEDDATPGEPHAVVLAYETWQTRFGADPSAVGQTMRVNGESMQIVGVGPRGFTGTTIGSRADIFVPITMRGRMIGRPPDTDVTNRRAYWAYLFGRLKPGVTIEQAKATLDARYRAILHDVEAPLQTGASETYMTRFRDRHLDMTGGARGQSTLRREAAAPITLLFALTAVVLLIACANVANLLLARSAARATEMAVRLSIGAARWHLVRQLLLEACLLGLMGGVAGLLVARWTLALIGSMLPSEAGSLVSLRVDGYVLAFAAGVSIATGVLFGLFPALHSTRPNLAITLKNQAGQPSGARSASYFRTALVVTQITASTVLLVGAGLFTKSLLNVSRAELGITVDRLVTFGLAPQMNGYSPERSRQFFEQVEDTLTALPNVTGVTGSMVGLIGGSNYGISVHVQGFRDDPDADTHAYFNEVGPDYFRTLGTPVLAGREFTRADGPDAPKVAIVNESFAKKFNLGRDAVGKRMAQGGGGGGELDLEIVGLVQDAHYSEVREEAPPPVFYKPYRQDARRGDLTFYVRTSGDPATLLRVIPPAIARLDANLPVDEPRTMIEQVRQNTAVDRMISTLAAAFAALATVLAAVGLYGVLAYTVTQRTREFGLRMALGADPGRVRRLVLGQVAWMTVIGAAIGTVAALVLGRMAQSQLFGVTGHDPVVITVAVLVLAVVAFGAGLLPARRAARLDPMRALRYE